MTTFTYNAITPKQSPLAKVFAFPACAKDIFKFASIDRIGRDDRGKLQGFQRSQVSNHIKEIGDYLSKEDAILPNSVVIAFTSGVTIKDTAINGVSEITITLDGKPQGLVVDGQQRLTALSKIPDKDFEVLVSCIICESEEELRKQFILINNTKALPKSLIYELLPTVNGLPARLSSRSMASSLTEQLNFDGRSSIFTKIKMHTNPEGLIQDTVVQKMLMNSLRDGALREIIDQPDGMSISFKLISDFFKAVAETFPEAWDRQTPRTSRLVHGAGIISMGYVMEYLYFSTKARTVEDFKIGLTLLDGKTAWTSGDWKFGTEEKNWRAWNDLQNLNRDWMALSSYLIDILKRAQREKQVA